MAKTLQPRGECGKNTMVHRKTFQKPASDVVWNCFEAKEILVFFSIVILQ